MHSQRELYGADQQASMMQNRDSREPEITGSSYTILNTCIGEDAISNSEKRDAFARPLVNLTGDDNYELNEPSSVL